MTPDAGAVSAVVNGLLELGRQYGPAVAAVWAYVIARKAKRHATEAAADAKRAREAQPAAEPTIGSAPAADPGPVPEPPTPPREITDSGVIRLFGYLDARLARIAAQSGRHAGEPDLERAS